MCTLLLAADVLPGLPLVVVANRDERLDRPAAPPALSADGRVLAPRDLVAFGTWLGLNRHGVFVAITNRFLEPKDASRVSRGALVAEALGQRSARAVHEVMADVDPARHNGFHLVYADVTGSSSLGVLATVSDGAMLAQLVLGRGLHVLTERSFGAGDDRRRRARIDAAWSRSTATEDGRPSTLAALDRLTTVLAEHDDDSPLDATCIHADAMGYGTRSGMVLGVDATGAARMLWAEGPPCRTPFVIVPDAATLVSTGPPR